MGCHFKPLVVQKFKHF